MEKIDTRIHKKEEVIAKIRPKASTLKLKTIPGHIVIRWYLITFPFKIIGAMEKIIENSTILAIIVQLSLTFGRFLNSNMSKAQIRGHKIANNGLMDSITVMVLLLIQILN